MKVVISEKLQIALWGLLATLKGRPEFPTVEFLLKQLNEAEKVPEMKDLERLADRIEYLENERGGDYE